MKKNSEVLQFIQQIKKENLLLQKDIINLKKNNILRGQKRNLSLIYEKETQLLVNKLILINLKSKL